MNKKKSKKLYEKASTEWEVLRSLDFGPKDRDRAIYRIIGLVEESIRNDPGNADALELKVDLMMVMGAYFEVIEFANQLVALAPANPAYQKKRDSIQKEIDRLS